MNSKLHSSRKITLAHAFFLWQLCTYCTLLTPPVYLHGWTESMYYMGSWWLLLDSYRHKKAHIVETLSYKMKAVAQLISHSKIRQTPSSILTPMLQDITHKPYVCIFMRHSFSSFWHLNDVIRFSWHLLSLSLWTPFWFPYAHVFYLSTVCLPPEVCFAVFLPSFFCLPVLRHYQIRFLLSFPPTGFNSILLLSSPSFSPDCSTPLLHSTQLLTCSSLPLLYFTIMWISLTLFFDSCVMKK